MKQYRYKFIKNFPKKTNEKGNTKERNGKDTKPVEFLIIFNERENR